MKSWFTLRLAVIIFASIAIFYILNYILIPRNFGFPPPNIHHFTWVLLSGTWLLGFVTMKFQYDRLPNPEAKPKPDFWTQLKGKNESGKSGPETLGEMTEKQQSSPSRVENPHDNPGPLQANEIRVTHDKNNGVGLTPVVEGVLKQSLADAELSMELELPENTEVKVFGETMKVRRGKVKIIPRKRPKSKLDKLMETPKTKKRRA